jgi:uncharacterized protein (DUF1015 family)
MPDLRPFRALHYNPAAAGDLARVIAPPYDVIDDAQWQRLFARSPFNVVRLILNRAADPYREAAATLAAWRREGVLVADRSPCLYYYVQNFRLPKGEPRERRGLIGAVRLQPFGEGTIYPHERTFARAKEDRLRLLDACRTNLSPIFGVYPDAAGALAPAEAVCAAEAPWIDVVDEVSERQRVWQLARAADIESITAALRDTPVFIADGHHRYETALAYRDRRRAQGDTNPDSPHHFILMYLASMEDSGLAILPTHRILVRLPSGIQGNWLDRLRPHFDLEAYPAGGSGVAALMARLNDLPGPAVGLRAAGRDELVLLRLREPHSLEAILPRLHPSVRSLAVTVLDEWILRRLLGVEAQSGLLSYTHREDEALRAVAEGGAAAAFLVRPPSMREVEAVCLGGQTMPEKSTYFYPKLLSGLVFHCLDDLP